MIKKSISIFALATLVLVSCKKVEKTDGVSASTGAVIEKPVVVKPIDPNAKFATMDFTETEHDFGTIDEGDKVETIFTFTNNGEVDLLITNATGSCGCTVPDYPKTPVKPGEKGTIKVSFNSNGKKGQQNKSVRITANTKTGIEKLAIKASVTPDPSKSEKSIEPKEQMTKEEIVKRLELQKQAARKQLTQKQAIK